MKKSNIVACLLGCCLLYGIWLVVWNPLPIGTKDTTAPTVVVVKQKQRHTKTPIFKDDADPRVSTVAHCMEITRVIVEAVQNPWLPELNHSEVIKHVFHMFDLTQRMDVTLDSSDTKSCSTIANDTQAFRYVFVTSFFLCVCTNN